MKYLSSKEVSGILGVNISTLKRWTESGKLGCEKTAGGHRKFTMQHVREYYKSNSNGTKSDLLSLESKDEVESVCDTCKVKRNAEKNMYVSVDADAEYDEYIHRQMMHF